MYLFQLTVDIFSGKIWSFMLRAEWKLEREVVSIDLQPKLPEFGLQPWIG